MLFLVVVLSVGMITDQLNDWLRRLSVCHIERVPGRGLIGLPSIS